MTWQRESNNAKAKTATHEHARQMRLAMTEPERRLWWQLRYRLSLQGSHFRRQFVIGPYIADFCCLAARLIVEVDGNQHGFDHQRLRDTARDGYLSNQGFQIIRFSNQDVMSNIDSVLDTILATLVQTTPTPGPSPQGGGEKEVHHVQQL